VPAQQDPPLVQALCSRMHWAGDDGGGDVSACGAEGGCSTRCAGEAGGGDDGCAGDG